jgi:hypothetical protein
MSNETLEAILSVVYEIKEQGQEIRETLRELESRVEKLESGGGSAKPAAPTPEFALTEARYAPPEAVLPGPRPMHLDRPMVERPLIDVWVASLEVFIDAEAPRVCMYSQLGGSAPCRKPAWFVIPRGSNSPVDLYGCREHAPLMSVIGTRPRRLARPSSLTAG